MKTQIYKKISMIWQQNECAPKFVQQSSTQEFEDIIKNKKSDIIWLAYHQG